LALQTGLETTELNAEKNNRLHVEPASKNFRKSRKKIRGTFFWG
jgi:hypothetical protein